MTTTSRSRWAALGAAVAVSLGAGGIGITHATTDSGDSPVAAFFPIEPCRLIANAIVAEDTSVTLNGWGASGNCDLPTGISGLVTNVTAVNATQQTNLRFFAQGDDVPETASLNPTPGAPPTPNAVTIHLSDTDGRFQLYNRFGSVGVYIDVVGYFDDHTHDDRYYTEDELDAVMPFAVDATREGFDPLTDTLTAVVAVDVAAPSDGQVTVNSSVNVFHATADGDVACILLRATDSGPPALGTNFPGIQWFESAGAGGNPNDGSLSGTRLFDVDGGSTTTFELRCAENDGDGGSVGGASLTAVFTPAPTT